MPRRGRFVVKAGERAVVVMVVENFRSASVRFLNRFPASAGKRTDSAPAGQPAGGETVTARRRSKA